MTKTVFLFFVFITLTGCTTSHSIIEPSLTHLDAAEGKRCYSPLKTFKNHSKILSKPQEKKVIVIDAGHGGKDKGTHSTTTPLYEEKQLNLATAKVLQRYLQKLGYNVLMTRTEDKTVELYDRSEYANKNGSDLFISVHFNSAPNKSANGVEVYYFSTKENPSRAKTSEQLASYVLQGILDKTQANKRGVKTGNLAVIRETNMTAILVEGGFLTNETERARILDPEYRKKIALGIATGVEHYFASRKLAAIQD